MHIAGRKVGVVDRRIHAAPPELAPSEQLPDVVNEREVHVKDGVVGGGGGVGHVSTHPQHGTVTVVLEVVAPACERLTDILIIQQQVKVIHFV